jgi:hypothetical protein
MVTVPTQESRDGLFSAVPSGLIGVALATPGSRDGLFSAAPSGLVDVGLPTQD